MNISKTYLQRFKDTVNDYYRIHKRNLPWRNIQDPYCILVSEIMLQQTQVNRVLTKYPLFINQFSDFNALAYATVKQVLYAWQGMGYNRRALYLKRIAEIVIQNYKGKLPDNPVILDSFPGIGMATAASITAFAYNKPTIFIETNIRRVFIHHFFKDKIKVDDKEIYPWVRETLNWENPREWYWALMDYGSFLGKSIDNPNKRSKHYTLQSQFEGSDRQIRGLLLKLLLTKPYTKKKIIALVNKDVGRIIKVLYDLEREKFIYFKKNVYYVNHT